MAESDSDASAADVWAVELSLGSMIESPTGEPLDRGGFFEWLWEQHGGDGLAGIDEGAISTSEAAALGLTPSALLIDAAAAPADRDWVGSLESAAVTCWFLGESAAETAAAQLRGLAGCRVLSVHRQPCVAPDDWKRAFGPIEVPGFGRILPAWEPGTASTSADGTMIFIDPGAGFGTGLHDTTQLCLTGMAERMQNSRPIDRLLDFGSGSGILGIAAALLGARAVLSVEIDPLVHAAIRANAERNGVAERVKVLQNMPVDTAGYDIVVANIVAPVLLEHAEDLCSRVRGPAPDAAGGCLILSGIVTEEIDRVVDRFSSLLRSRLGESAVIRTTSGAWHCIRFESASSPARPAAESDWLVYLLQCRDGSLYTGITNDLPKRLEAHAAGKASRYTRSRLPVTLVYVEPQPTKSLALRREAAIKRLPRAEKLLLAARV